MTRKKAQGISITTIVVAAIALVVLIVMVAIFTGRLDIFGGNVNSCSAKGGGCGCYTVGEDGKVTLGKPGDDCTGKTRGCPSEYAIVEGTDCNADDIVGNDLCCIPI